MSRAPLDAGCHTRHRQVAPHHFFRRVNGAFTLGGNCARYVLVG